MGKDEDEERDRAIEREIRVGRGFSLGDVIGREGGNYLKGASPVAPGVQAFLEIAQFLGERTGGALRTVLHMEVKASETVVGKHYDAPLRALEVILERVLGSEADLVELVRSVDFEWGRQMLERPHFQKQGQPADPDDPYTHESVRAALSALLDETRRALEGDE